MNLTVSVDAERDGDLLDLCHNERSLAGIAQGLERLTVAEEAVGSRPIIRPKPTLPH
jgi:hypothetical protein